MPPQQEGIVSVLNCLLNRGPGTEAETMHFADTKHDALVTKLVDYLNSHRHYLGYCHIEITQALNDRGVDLFLEADNCKIGFQIKSHFDVTEKDFASKVKRQFAEALSYELDHYYILICTPMRIEGRKDLRQRVAHLLNELRLFRKINFDAFGPLSTIQYLRFPIIVSRDELLKRKAITEVCPKEFEKGFEHLPEVNSPEIVAAEKCFEKFGDDWWEDDDGNAAWQQLKGVIEQAKADQFMTNFWPTLPPNIQQKRSDLVSSIQLALEQCRKCESWDERSEYKLPQWLDQVEESMIPYTSLPNLLSINESVAQYLEIHQEMGNGRPDSIQDEGDD